MNTTYTVRSNSISTEIRTVSTEMLCNFQHESRFSVGNLQCIQDWRQMIIKLDIHNGADYGNNATLGTGLGLGSCLGRIIPTCNYTNSKTQVAGISKS